MKKLIPALLALLLVFSMSVQQTFAALSFKDVGTDFWASKIIQQYAEKGIIKGYSDDTFRPDNSVTRAQAAVMLSRALELDIENVKAVSYKDVDQKHSAYKAIAAVTNKGIMSGYEGKFNPDKPLTRGQMAAVLTNAFDLKGQGKSAFKDVTAKHSSYAAVDALFANGVTTGYGDKTFKPSEPTSRAHFVVFLSRVLDGKQAEVVENPELVALLEEVYANEFDLETYEFEGTFNFGITMPKEMMQDPDMAMIADALKDIKVDMKGAYKKDPLQFEATIDVHVKGQVNQTFSMPMVMTQDKMWIKFPETDLMPLPEEIKGKFIEMDLAAMNAEMGQVIDLETQMNLSKELTSAMIEKLGAQFYEEVPTSSVKAPAGIDVNKVIKFEITNEDLEPFMNIVINDLLPKVLEIMQDPAYQEALGLTEEDAAMMSEGFDTSGIDIPSMIAELSKFLSINKLEELIVITQDNYIGYDVFKLDLTINALGQKYGFKMGYDLEKSKVNEAVNFTYGIPSGADVVPYEKLMELEEAMYEEMYTEEYTEEAAE